jgi:hypothetical protein
MTKEQNMKPIKADIHDPRRYTSDPWKSRPASITKIFCTAEKCDLRDRGFCTMAPIFGWFRCPHAEVESEEGPSRRSKKIGPWITQKKTENAEMLALPFRDHGSRMGVCGDYVFFPYAHADYGNKVVPFLCASTVFSKGQPFLKLSDFTAENMLAIIDHRPHALMGGEITSYQTEVVPKILAHLREDFPKMWETLCVLRPSLAGTVIKNVGRKAYLKTLNASKESPLEILFKNECEGGRAYPVKWIFDGETLTTSSPHAYQDTWGKISLPETVSVRMVPSNKTVIVVQSESWVCEKTKFAD